MFHNHIRLSIVTLILSTISIFAHARAPKAVHIVGKEITYNCNGKIMKGFLAYDDQIKGKRPAIIVVPEWWGNNDYAKMRARMLAELGYIALAADMYGNGLLADNPQKAQEYATPFYKDPKMGKDAIDAAIKQIKEYPQTNPNAIAAIGYCFGGSMVLNSMKMGTELKAVVSFHGGLATVPATKGAVKGKILVCHGAADQFITPTDIANFKTNLDTLGVPYQFIAYADATHAFTNPASTENGKKFKMPIAYNQAADKKSWADMKTFLKSVF